MNERTLFLAALAITDPAARAGYLKKECANDAALRQRVEALLKAHNEAGSFLEKPAADAGATGAYTPVAGLNEAGQPSSMTAATASEGPGTRIGPYKLLQQIGEGGMGVVYMAEQQEPVRRMVALKIIKAGMDSKEVVARFDAERQALAVMDHQNIAKVFDAGATSSGRLYFVMELVKGTPITKYCDEHRLTPRERLELFMPVCHALQHAHQKGIIHRDIKPSNVLVAPYDGKPVVKVIDFGIAKATGQRLTERTMFTEFGAVIGTLEYMSPEQAELNNQDIDTRSDIYSLGVLLYELLTGTTPLDRTRLKKTAFTEMLRIIREEEPPRPSMRLSGSNELPSISAQRQTEPAKLSKLMRGDLDWIVMKSLDKDRARRYETANGLARDIERYLKDEAVEACPPSAGYRMRKLMRRYKTPLRVAAALFLVLVSGVIVSAWLAVRATQAEEVANLERDNARMARDAEQERAGELGVALKKTTEAEQAEKQRAGELAVALKQAEQASLLEKQTREKAEEDLATSTMMLARSRFQQDNLELAAELLEKVSPKYRGSSWGLLKNHMAGSLFRLYGHTSWVVSASYSPDGQTIASGSEDKTLRLWDAITGDELRVLRGHTHSVWSVRYSPDGQTLASGGEDRTVRIWDAKNGQALRVFKGHENRVNCVAYAPDGLTVASAGWDKTVRLWDVKSGQELGILKGHENRVNSVSFSPDGKTVASASQDSTVRLWDVKSGQQVQVLKGHTIEVMTVTFSPDGETLASGGWDGTVRLWDAKSGQELRVLGKSSMVTAVSFSPDGQRLAAASVHVRVWNVKTGEQLHLLKGHASLAWSVSYSPNGRFLASGGDKTVRVWDAELGQEPRALKGHTAGVTSVSYSPDGRTLASGSYDKSVRLWDAICGHELRVLKGHTDKVNCVCYSRDGHTLASASDDGTVRLWDAKSGKELNLLTGQKKARCVSFSRDGKILASAGDDSTVRLWDAKSGQELRVLKGHKNLANAVSFSPDGLTLASAGWDETVLWDVQSGQLLRILTGHSESVYGVSWSPDGQTLATASWDKTVRLWETKSGQELHVLKGHEQGLLNATYSPDGQTLASAGAIDETVRLWDAKSGQELRVLSGQNSPVISVCYSPDGQTLAAANGDKTVRLWDMRSIWTPPGEPIPESELAFRRWVTRPDPEWHVEKRQVAEKENNSFAAAFHRSWEQHARGVLALEAGDFNMAFAHFVAAAALKPKVHSAGK